MGTVLKILVIEDSKEDFMLLRHELIKGGFEPDTERVDREDTMLQALAKGGWELALCDYHFPDFSAEAALRLWKEKVDHAPFIVVSGAIGEEEAVNLLKEGASDFVKKENMTRLIPAIHRELREAEEHKKRKQAEEELKKYREHLEELVEERTNELKEKTDKIEESRKALTYLVEDVNKAREDLEKANERLKELDQLKSMFIASMSHELRTPLNSIIGFTGIILQGLTGEINAEQKDQLKRVSGSAKHLLNLITDIIDISKIEAGKVEVYTEEFDLDGVVKEAISSLKPEIDNKGLGLEISLLPDLQLTTDRKRLLQCILNYLSNAVKFTEKGKIKITAHEVGATAGLMPRDVGTRDERTKDEGRKGEGRKDEETAVVLGREATGRSSSIVISVADTGIGIKEEDIPKLFGSFVRLDTPLRTVIPGTGLGLYLTKKLATEVLKGSVSVESKYGEGSVFTLRIPRRI